MTLTSRLFSRIVAISLAALLVGCSTAPRTTGQQWTGKFSVATIYKKKAERDSGTFLLTKHGKDSELVLKGPLGAAAAVIEETPTGAVLKVPNEQPVYAASSASLSMRLIGAPISLEQLVHWMESNGTFQGTLADELNANGWTVDIEKNDNAIRRITAQREETKTQPAVKLILVPTPQR